MPAMNVTGEARHSHAGCYDDDGCPVDRDLHTAALVSISGSNDSSPASFRPRTRCDRNPGSDVHHRNRHPCDQVTGELLPVVDGNVVKFWVFRVNYCLKARTSAPKGE
jgi:hypothetical protein